LLICGDCIRATRYQIWLQSLARQEHVLGCHDHINPTSLFAGFRHCQFTPDGDELPCAMVNLRLCRLNGAVPRDAGGGSAGAPRDSGPESLPGLAPLWSI
jgi:hypothetical protein